MKRTHMQWANNPTMTFCQTGPGNFSRRKQPITTTDKTKVTCKACLKALTNEFANLTPNGVTR